MFFDRRPVSVRDARDFVTDTLTDWGLTDRAEDVCLCVSELATNAFVHGTPPGCAFLVKLTASNEMLRLEVHDSGQDRPEPQVPGEDDVNGRGLFLVAMLADHWGVDDQKQGKTVWSEFTCGDTANIGVSEKIVR